PDRSRTAASRRPPERAYLARIDRARDQGARFRAASPESLRRHWGRVERSPPAHAEQAQTRVSTTTAPGRVASTHSQSSPLLNGHVMPKLPARESIRSERQIAERVGEPLRTRRRQRARTGRSIVA